MHAAHRTEENPALALAVERANALGLPLVVVFVLVPGFPEANGRHLTFMLEGLTEVFSSLRELGGVPVLRLGDPVEHLVQLAKRAGEMVWDQGYLRWHKSLYSKLQERIGCRLFQVEGEAAVPVETASSKAEYAARTIRPRLQRHFQEFLVPCQLARVSTSPAGLNIESLDGRLDDLLGLLATLGVDPTVKPVGRFFQGGPTAAREHLEQFLEVRFSQYEERRNQPQTDATSMMSPFLHYGMISPVAIARAVQDRAHPSDPNRQSYLEELLIRRGLSQNFCHFTENYDHYLSLPDWARQTLAEHSADPRPYLYSQERLENASTHDPYWNAAQTEMIETGYMHNYMRMYWGKKILEWSENPEQAYQVTLRLNNRYLLDGRDPVSFANVGWIFGLHDRPWQERAIYGKVRCMMASGLERKFKPWEYVRKVQRATGREILSG